MSRDKEEKIDLDKVKIEMPTDMPGAGQENATPNDKDPFAPPPLEGTQPVADPTAAASGAPAPSAADEQKKVADLIKQTQ